MIIINISFSFGIMVGFLLHYQTLIAQGGREVIALVIVPYLIVGLLIIGYQFLFGKRKNISSLFCLTFFPSLILTEFGLSTLLFYGILTVMNMTEKKYRKNVVKLVSFFSETYSPLYEERKKNKRDYLEYQQAFRLLKLVNTDDFELIREVRHVTKNWKEGIVNQQLERTFKIKGIPGTTTILDQLYTSPQKRILRMGRKII
ncbi:TPA: hypothetical protein ACQ0F8_001619 [Streptococcus agalactiae]